MKVSVIVPIYNVEKMLAKTLESIAAQTLMDFEVLLIDDCSTDNSGEICKRFSENDKRFKYIRNIINSGPSYSRNVGIKLAQGDYISFIDSDDLVDPNFLKLMYTVSIKYDCDITWCNFKYLYTETNKIHLDQNEKKGLIPVFEFIKCYIYNINGSSPLWNKLYKKSFLYENNLLIDEKRKNGEDGDFNLRSALCKPIVYVLPDFLYTYVVRPINRISNTYFTCDFDSSCAHYELLSRIADNYGIKNWQKEINKRYICKFIVLIKKVFTSNNNDLDKNYEVKRIYSHKLFRKLIKHNIFINYYLPISFKISALAFRCRLNSLGIFILKFSL